VRCGACDRECRSTSLAFVADDNGGLTRKRVCGTCFDGALHVVVSVTTVPRGENETKAERRDAAAVTRAAARKIRGMAKAYGAIIDDRSVGRAAGLEQAADILDAGDF
jgi:hypothetical protein